MNNNPLSGLSTSLFTKPKTMKNRYRSLKRGLRKTYASMKSVSPKKTAGEYLQKAVKTMKTIRNKLATRGKVHNLKSWLEKGKQELKKEQEKQAYANVQVAKTLKSLRPVMNIGTRKAMMNANRAARLRVPNAYPGYTRKALPTMLARNIHRMKTTTGAPVTSFYGPKQKRLDNAIKKEIDLVSKRIQASKTSNVAPNQKRKLLRTLRNIKNTANIMKQKRERHAQLLKNIYGL